MRSCLVVVGLLLLFAGCAPTAPDKANPASRPVSQLDRSAPPSPQSGPKAKTLKEERRRWCEQRQQQVNDYLEALQNNFSPSVRNNFPEPLDLKQSDIHLVAAPVEDPCLHRHPLPVELKVQLNPPRFHYRLDGRRQRLILGNDPPQYAPTLHLVSSRINTLSPNLTIGDELISFRLVDIQVLDQKVLRARYQVNNNSNAPLQVTGVRLQVQGDVVEKPLHHRIGPHSGSEFSLEHRILGTWDTVSRTLSSVTPSQYRRQAMTIGTQIDFRHDNADKSLKGATRQSLQALEGRYL